MLHAFTCLEQRQCHQIPLAEVVEQLQDSQARLWLEGTQLTDDEWEFLTTHFPFHPLAIEDARQQGQRPKMDVYDDYLFVSAHYWSATQESTVEMDIFLGKNYLIVLSAVEEPDSPLLTTRTRWERHPERLSHEIAFLFYALLDAIVDSYFPILDRFADEIEELETMIYAASLQLNITDALRLKKRLMVLRQAVTPLRDIVNQLLRIEDDILPASLRLYFQDIFDHTLRLTEQIDMHRDILSGAFDALVAQNGNRLNQVMKTMTALSTILMTVALISGIYGMNFDNMPELHHHNGYFWALGAMATSAGVMGLYFKKIGWI
jgi:magnesium transporter